MSLKDAINNLKFDTRMQETNVKRGSLSSDELSNYLNSLEDVAAKAESITLDEDSHEAETAPEAAASTDFEQPASFPEGNGSDPNSGFNPGSSF